MIKAKMKKIILNKTIKIAINQQEEQINMKSNKKISTKKKTKKIIMRDKLKIRIIRNQKNLKKLVKMLKDKTVSTLQKKRARRLWLNLLAREIPVNSSNRRPLRSKSYSMH